MSSGLTDKIIELSIYKLDVIVRAILVRRKLDNALAANRVVRKHWIYFDDLPGLARQTRIVCKADEINIGACCNWLLVELLVIARERGINTETTTHGPDPKPYGILYWMHVLIAMLLNSWKLAEAVSLRDDRREDDLFSHKFFANVRN